ncbi:MAG TPA: DMT family transporter [Elusimicrobiales bacterium]|nr:DMT family transporter [Elusimicrobiales bacterium]
MHMKTDPKTAALYDLGLFYCAAIWGSTFIVTKSALDNVHPITMVGIRFLISALAILPWALKRPSFTRHMKEGFGLAFFLCLLYMTQTAGLQFTTASNSGFITGLFIIFIPVFMFLARGEKPKRMEVVSALLAIAGMWLLTGGVRGFNLGDGLTLIAAMAYSGHLIITDRYVKSDADPLLLAFHQFWITGAVAMLFAALMGWPMGVNGAKGWWIIVFLALFPTLSAFYIQMLAQRRSDPFKVGIIFTLEPVFAAAFAWTLGGEEFFWVKAAGGFLIVSGMLLGELAKFRLRRAAAREVLPI